MEETSLSIKIANYLIENFELSTTQRGAVKIGDFSLSGVGLAKRFTTNIILENKSCLKEIDESLLTKKDSDIITEMTNYLPSAIEYLHKYMLEDRVNKTSDNIDTIINKEDYINAVPVVDMEDPRGSAIMLDKTTWRPSLVEERAWERIVGPQHVDTLRKIGYCGRFEYNPYSLNPFREIQTSLGTESMYNKYIPPKTKTERDLTIKLDKRFVEFFEGLFTTEGSRQYAIDWILSSTERKNPVYMVLVGAGGIGKNLLAESLKYLHGSTNFTKAPPSALNSKFNGHLDQCTMLYYDECKFSPDKGGGNIRKNRLKEWANDYVPVEKKGLDAKDSSIYCSAIISSNHDSDIHLEQLDRKFSAMELSSERMEKRLGIENTRWIWDYIQHTDFPQGFLSYLNENASKEFNENIEYRGQKFEDLIISSLTTWQYELLFTYILSGQSKHYKLSSLKENVPMFPTRYSKVNDFLENFTWDNVKLGRIVTVDGSKVVKVNDKFAPVENKGMDLNKEL